MEVKSEDVLWKIIVRNEVNAWHHSKPSVQALEKVVTEAGRSRSHLSDIPSPAAEPVKKEVS